MSKNPTPSSFFYITIIFYVLISNKILLYVQQLAKSSYYMLLYFAMSTVLFFILGAFLGYEQFMSEKKKKGRWQINWTKFICLGIPSLFFSQILFLYNYLPAVTRDFIYNIGFYPAMNNISIHSTFQLLLGYTMVTSFYKNEKINRDNDNEGKWRDWDIR